MELVTLLEKLKMDHLEAQLDAVCEQAAQRDLDYKTFLACQVAHVNVPPMCGHNVPPMCGHNVPPVG